MFSLVGKKCIVTGANQGIGFAIAKRFLGEGAKVCLVGRNSAKVDEAVQELQKLQSARTDAHQSIHGYICEISQGQKDWIGLFDSHVSSQWLILSFTHVPN